MRDAQLNTRASVRTLAESASPISISARLFVGLAVLARLAIRSVTARRREEFRVTSGIQRLSATRLLIECDTELTQKATRRRCAGSSIPQHASPRAAVALARFRRPVAPRFFTSGRTRVFIRPLTFLSQQSFGYCPRAKRSRSNTRAGVVGYLFETAHQAIAPMWQPGAYIRSCELRSVVEGVHSNLARKPKGWLEHEIRHAAETREA
jgi:hypothetical protein